MKKIIIGLIVLLSLAAFSVGGNDPSKYIWYRYTYGNRLPRVWADTVLQVPADTLWSKDGLAIKNGIFYVGNGTVWTEMYKKPPTDFQHFVSGSDLRDTTITMSFPCSFGPTVTISYVHYHLPQFIGLRVRVSSAVQNAPEDFCEYGWWYHWDSLTGDVWIYGAGINEFDIIQGY